MPTNTEEAVSNPHDEASSRDKIEQKKIDHLERIINNLNEHWHSIQLLIGYVSQPLRLDDRGLAHTLHCLKETLGSFLNALKEMDISQAMGEIRFIGKRLDAIEKSIEKIRKDGIDRHVKLDLTLDGYTMVKKKINHDPDMPIEDPNKALDDLLNCLNPNQKQCIVYRFGLYSEKAHTQAATARKMKLSAERIRQMYARSLRLLRHPCRKDKVANINHRLLYKEITGNDLEV